MNKIIVFAILIFSFTGCMSKKSSITASTKYEEEKIGKLFVLMDIPKEELYANDFAKKMQEELSERGIPSQIYVKQKLDLLNDTDLEKLMSDFGTTHYLFVSNRTYYSNEINKTITYDVSLMNYEKGTKIWKGCLNLKLGIIKKTSQAENDAMLLINELKINHFL